MIIIVINPKNYSQKIQKNPKKNSIAFKKLICKMYQQRKYDVNLNNRRDSPTYINDSRLDNSR
jgi:hypothetical protein